MKEGVKEGVKEGMKEGVKEGGGCVREDERCEQEGS